MRATRRQEVRRLCDRQKDAAAAAALLGEVRCVDKKCEACGERVADLEQIVAELKRAMLVAETQGRRAESIVRENAAKVEAEFRRRQRREEVQSRGPFVLYILHSAWDGVLH